MGRFEVFFAMRSTSSMLPSDTLSFGTRAATAHRFPLRFSIRRQRGTLREGGHGSIATDEVPYREAHNEV